MRALNPAQQRLRVCEACGAQLNILDHESRDDFSLNYLNLF